MLHTTKFFHWLLFIVFGFFLTRCFDLMVIRGGYFRKLSDENRVRKLAISPARGLILDRKGNELARNSVKYFDSEEKIISRDQAIEQETKGRKVIKKWIREYPGGEVFSHITGYLNEAAEEDLKDDEKCQVRAGDLVGREGVEQVYDCQLRGVFGERLVETDAMGKIIRELGKREALAGDDISLSIDSRWQKAAYEALRKSEKKGAAVVLDPKNGEVLALVSLPSFDPNVFTRDRNDNKIVTYLGDQDLPFLNRAISGAYHPGSVFKITTAAAGLEEGKINASTEVEDVGEIKIGEWRFGNWYYLDYGRTEGAVNLVKAIKRSNDIYFYKAGEWVGEDLLIKWAKKFGFGELTRINLPAEVSGFLPSPEWKEKVKGERWFLGNTYHLAIGQGDLTATPLQIAVETAVVANGGRRCRPTLKLKVKSEKLKVEDECEDLGIRKENVDLIKKGMVEACLSGGTGFPFFNFKPPGLPADWQVACKTGTAEVGDGTEDTHAWFSLFYPVNDPKYVVTVLLERGGQGSYDAAPVAKQIIETVEGRE